MDRPEIKGEGVIEFFVPGTPRPAGSKRGFPVKGRDGRVHVAMTDSSGAKGKSWRVACVAAVTEVWHDDPISEPIRLEVEFVMPRPGTHFGKRKGEPYLKPDAPTRHTAKPDATKLLRALEDALTGVVWKDDAQVVEQFVSKRYGPRPGANVIVTVESA